MASNYAAFTVVDVDTNGVPTNVGAGVSVKARADGAGSDAAESPLTTGLYGVVAAGSFASIAANTVVHFRIENRGGKAGTLSQVTT